MREISIHWLLYPRTAAIASSNAIFATASRWATSCSTTSLMFFCILPQRPMSTGRSMGRRSSYRPMWLGLSRSFKLPSLTGERFPTAAGDRFRFHHVSTDEVFGSLGDDGFFHENYPYQPNSPYSASKAASDHFVRAWHHTYGLPTVITNCSNNYGPYHFPEKLIPLTILNALEGKSLPVYGKGENVRDWLYVDDHADALILVAEQGRAAKATTLAAGTNELTSMWCGRSARS